METILSDFLVIIKLILTMGIIAILISLFLLLDYKNRKTERNKNYLLWTLMIIVTILVSILLVVDGIEILALESLHIGLLFGFPALIVLTIGTILVLYDEPKYVLYHGYFAGSSWILTLINVILLITLTEQMILDYSGLIHTVHILCGGTGLATGFVTMLFGISGQRRLSKLTGYITLGCWWGAFLLGLFLPKI